MTGTRPRAPRVRSFLAAFAAAAAAALGLWPSAAEAATPTGDSIGPTKNATNWIGQFYAAGTVSDPTLCPPAAVDPINLVCDHFQLNVEAAGAVQVRVDWPDPDDDFDLYVCLNGADDPADGCAGGREIASSASGAGTFELLTFQAAAATYEIRVIPFFVVANGYDGQARFVTDVPPATGGSFALNECGGATATGRRVDGGGKQAAVTQDALTPEEEVAHFAVDVRLNARNELVATKVRYEEQSTRFRSTSVTCVRFDDGGQQAEIRGKGILKDAMGVEQGVCFRAVADDNQQPVNGDSPTDRFELQLFGLTEDTLSCRAAPIFTNGAGTVRNGDIRYRFEN